jgi:hypothetical protein
MNKGNGQHLQGVRWLMASNILAPSYWLTDGYYTRAEVNSWECAYPVQPLYPLDIEL